MQAEKKAAKEAAKAKAAASAAPSDAAAAAASSPVSSQPPAVPQADSFPAAPAHAAPSSQPSVAPRLSSSIAKAANSSSPPAPSGRVGADASRLAPASSSRQLLTRQQTQRGPERAREGAPSPLREGQQGEKLRICRRPRKADLPAVLSFVLVAPLYDATTPQAGTALAGRLVIIPCTRNVQAAYYSGFLVLLQTEEMLRTGAPSLVLHHRSVGISVRREEALWTVHACCCVCRIVAYYARQCMKQQDCLQALPPGDLRHLLSRGKSNTEEVIRGEPVEPRPSIRRQGSHQQRQQQAPHTVDERDLMPPRTRLAGPTRHARR